MKKLSLILTFVALNAICYSQEIIELKFNPAKKDFDKKTQSLKFKSGVSYKIKITGLNTSIIDYKINSKSYTLTSTIPDIIKPVFPGITEGFVFDLSRTKQIPDEIPKKYFDPNTLLKQSKYKYYKLSELEKISDSLYESTKTEINTKEAESVMNDAKDLFKVKSIEELKQQVILYSKYIIVVQELYKKIMEDNPTDETINSYNNLSFMADSIKSKNYLIYANFIENSLKAKDYVEYNPFKAEKDMVDLNLTFIDSYTKDTVYNSSLPFYTHGNFSFDFSTGFFFNNLHEKSYYIEKRDALKNNVLVENNSSFDVSIGALGHLSYKISNYFKAGLSIGTALSPLDGKIRYLLGGSLLFGRQNQLGINGGLVLAKMNVLSNSVKNDGIGNYVLADITSVPKYEKIQSGFYVGLTYNLISTKK